MLKKYFKPSLYYDLRNATSKKTILNKLISDKQNIWIMLLLLDVKRLKSSVTIWPWRLGGPRIKTFYVNSINARMAVHEEGSKRKVKRLPFWTTGWHILTSLWSVIGGCSFFHTKVYNQCLAKRQATELKFMKCSHLLLFHSLCKAHSIPYYVL